MPLEVGWSALLEGAHSLGKVLAGPRPGHRLVDPTCHLGRQMRIRQFGKRGLARGDGERGVADDLVRPQPGGRFEILCAPHSLGDRAEFERGLHRDRLGGEEHPRDHLSGQAGQEAGHPEGGYPTPSLAGVMAIRVSAVAMIRSQLRTSSQAPPHTSPPTSAIVAIGRRRKYSRNPSSGLAHTCSMASSGISLMSWPLDQMPLTGSARRITTRMPSSTALVRIARACFQHRRGQPVTAAGIAEGHPQNCAVAGDGPFAHASRV